MWSRAYPVISADCVRITHSASSLQEPSRSMAGHGRRLRLIRCTRLIRFIRFIEFTRAHQVRPGFFMISQGSYICLALFMFSPHPNALDCSRRLVPMDTSICLFGTQKRHYGTLHDINFHRSPFCLAYVICPLLSLPILAVLLLSYVWVFFR